MHYDVIIIGSGAGGGTLAYALATTGKRILLLERGESIPKEDANWNPASSIASDATRRPRPGMTMRIDHSDARRSTTSGAIPSGSAPF